MKNVKGNPMKKIISLAVILATVLTLMIPVFASAGAYGTDVWVNCENGKRLNLRPEPRTNSGLITRFVCGTRLEVMEDLGNGWVHVTDGEYTGYVQKKFLVAKKPGKYEITERDDNFVAVTPYIVTAKALNNRTDDSVGLRVKPNKTARATRRLAAGDELEVIARGKTWSRVIDLQTGKTGYMANDYMVKV